MTDKPHAPATERNREPILAELRALFADHQRVLEIGSGTGQHAVFFAAALPHLVWQCSDRVENLPGIRLWLADAGLANTPAPLALDVIRDPWPSERYDAVFSANTLHIMPWQAVEALFAGLPAVLHPSATVAIYGPFNRNGIATSDSNAAFDAKLRSEQPHMGLRDVEAVDALAQAAGLALIADIAMPANNALRVWRLVKST
ncbi:MAG TPA: methylase [Xanthomonadales bacterium]|nr:methylase [Xanthomonadales bacterium]